MNHLQTLREISQQQQEKDKENDEEKAESAPGTSSQTNA